MKRVLLAASAFLCIGLALPAFAQIPGSPVRTEKDTVSMTLGNDLYVSGGNPNASRGSSGDVVIAGGNVLIDGRVRGDVLAAGGQIVINATVGDDIRAAGGQVVVSGIVYGDVVIAGGTLTIQKDAVIKGNLVAFGGTVIIDGTVEGSTRMGGGTMTVNGTLKGKTDIRGGDLHMNGSIVGPSVLSVKTFTSDPQATMGGQVRYWTAAGAIDLSSIVTASGSATYDPTLAQQHNEPVSTSAMAAAIGVWSIFSFLSAIVLLLVLLLLFPRSLKTAGERLQAHPWISLLTGFLYYAAVPVLILLLFLTLIGIPLGLLLLCVYLLTVFFGSVLTSLVAARAIEKQAGAKWHLGIVLLVALGVWLVLKFLWVIPFLGWLLKVIIIFFGMGALFLSVWSARKTV